MTYQSGPQGKIQASDINGFLQNNPYNINSIWGTGTGDRGYGQSNIPTVSVSNKIRYSTWLSLINNITSAAAHQGTSITQPMARQEAVPAPSVKSILLSSITDNLQSITANRLNAARQGNDQGPSVKTADAWINGTTLTFTVRFADHDRARYFFNSGGQIGVYTDHLTSAATSGNNINRLIKDVCSGMGTIWLSSPTSTNTVKLGPSGVFTGVYKAGGYTGGGSTTVTGYGFHSPWSSTATTIHTQQGTYNYRGHGPNTYGTYFYASSAVARVKLSYNGSGTITVAIEFTGLTNITISRGLTAYLTVRPPSSNLAASWGTISIS
jgi:hypothetical protein